MCATFRYLVRTNIVTIVILHFSTVRRGPRRGHVMNEKKKSPHPRARGFLVRRELDGQCAPLLPPFLHGIAEALARGRGSLNTNQHEFARIRGGASEGCTLARRYCRAHGGAKSGHFRFFKKKKKKILKLRLPYEKKPSSRNEILFLFVSDRRSLFTLFPFVLIRLIRVFLFYLYRFEKMIKDGRDSDGR